MSDQRCASDCMWVGGGAVGGMEGLERCPRKRPGSEPETVRRVRAPTGAVGAKSRLAGVAEEPCPAGAEEVRRVAAAEVLIVNSKSDMVVSLGGDRGCTTDEGNSQGRDGCRTRGRRGNQCRAVAPCNVGEHVQTFAFWREVFHLRVGLYGK